ncbi:myb-like protein X isoform X2 [Achroia grisella]|uniref:myb-like protein X isoform X2 n=1 Tax=Achroia grisella TaxID=688607 RepID=UPI0027D33D7F|nr:myb-like protein X isoform X2 [Achroia grisella]
MSQKASTRKGGVNEDKEKEKRQTESPVNDIKKKVVANSEKEKQVAEKSTDKTSEKKSEKSNDKTEKNVDKADKKTTEKNAEKKSEAQEKTKEDSSKGEKSGKEKQDEKKDTRKQNGKDVHNGVSNVTNTNGTDEALNGTVSESDDDEMLVIDDHDQDELFPELTYDDTSDAECFEPPTPENAPSRSLTRRSQSKDSKVLKMKDDALTTDRKLRSADSPKPEGKKETTKQTQDSPKKQDPKKTQDNESKQGGDKTDVEIVIDLEDSEEAAGAEESRKTDTNFSKSRVKVSPYRRSGRTSRLADHTASSVMANYTGNNTTMEMDITETSSFVSEDPSLDDSYLSGLRTIRGRRSYKPLKEMALRNIGANRSLRSVASLNSSEQPSRPTGTVVGRKRKQENDEVELGEEAQEAIGDMEVEGAVIGKRRRLLERLAQPFRRTLASTPLPARRAAEIVGINTDLPLSAPVSSGDSFDPESLKASASTPVATPLDNPTVTTNGHDKDSKRCIVM